MLSKDFQIRLLAERNKISKDEAAKIVNAEDEQIPELIEGKMYTPDEVGQIETNSFNDGKRDGFIFGVDELVDNFKKVNELDFEGKAIRENAGKGIDINATTNLMTTQIDNKFKSTYTGKKDEIVKNLEESIEIKDKNFAKKIQEAEEKAKKAENELNDIKNNNILLSNLPENISNQKGMLHHFKAEFVPFQENGKYFAKDNLGNIIKDELGNPKPLIDVRNEFIDRENYINKENLGGGGGEGNKDFKTADEFYTYLKQNKIEPTSREGLQLQTEARAKGVKF